MNIIKSLKSLFKGKKINQEIQEETNIVGFDTSYIVLPKIKDLSQEDQELVKRYQNEINVEKFKSLLDYVKRISDESQLVTNLLIEYIYEYDKHTLKVKTSPDDKTMNEERINLLFLNQKINLLKGELKKLKKESILKTISLQEVLKFESKRIYDFLGIFGFASKIKRENLKRSLSDAINNMKIAIITINQQIMAINNALENAYQTINSVDVLNIIENEKTKLIKQEIYLKKTYNLISTYEYLLDKNFPIAQEIIEIINSLSLENEIELIKILSSYQVELEKFIYANKEEIIEKINNKLNVLNNRNISKEEKENILEEIKKIEILLSYIKEIDKKKLYSLKFKILTIDIFDSEINPFVKPLNKEELEIYKNIISKELQEFFKPRENKYKNYSNLLFSCYKSYLKMMRRDILLSVLVNITTLRTILLVNHPTRYQYEINKMIINDVYNRGKNIYVFDYNPDIFLESSKTNSFCIDSSVQDYLEYILHSLIIFPLGIRKDIINDFIEGKNSSKFMLLFLLISGKCVVSKPFGYNYVNDVIVIKDGITAVGDIKSLGRGKNQIVATNIDKTMHEIVFPETLTEIRESTFTNFELNEINFPKNLKRIERHTFFNSYGLEDTEFPKDIEYLDDEAYMTDKMVFDNLDKRTSNMRYGKKYASLGSLLFLADKMEETKDKVKSISK